MHMRTVVNMRSQMGFLDHLCLFSRVPPFIDNANTENTETTSNAEYNINALNI